jgi:SAM-dependent methyltransferase
MGKIFETLSELGLTSADSKKLYHKGTRDRDDIDVWRDENSGVIFIDDFYVGQNEYASGDYRNAEIAPDYEDFTDTKRRLSRYAQFYIGKNICDVGCGAGSFIRQAAPNCQSACAVELQKSFADSLIESGINCEDSIRKHTQSFEAVFMFHSLEHFDDPVALLNDARQNMEPGGYLIAEVPHANDFLISTLQSQSFIDFTLWSQHLILHTRKSLEKILLQAGFSNIIIEGTQRYPLSNHLRWLTDQTPGGHKGKLSLIDTPDLVSSYENALRKIDATDTLVAIAEF